MVPRRGLDPGSTPARKTAAPPGRREPRRSSPSWSPQRLISWAILTEGALIASRGTL